MAQALEIILVSAPNEDVRVLIDELNEELGALYTPEQRHGLALSAIFQPHIRFFVACRDGNPVGCGGVAMFDGFAEVKRLYVRAALRGQGIADAFMAHLAAEAISAGRGLLRLETGSHSHAAIRFYDRLGFCYCDPFAPYAAMPPASIVTSVFMEKRVL